MGRFGILLLTVWGLSYALNQHLIDSDVYTVDEGVDTIILGDSHAVYAFDPALIRNSVNVAQEGEPYLVTYHKLRLVLSSSSGIANVVLSFSPHHISAFNDRKFSEQEWSGYIFDKYYPLVSAADLQGLRVDWRRYARSVLQNQVLPNLRYLMNRIRKVHGRGEVSYPYVGGFVPVSASFLNEKQLAERLKRHFGESSNTSGVSEISVSYLDRIVELVESEGKNLYLARTPLHPDYARRIPPAIAFKYEVILSRLSHEHHVCVLRLEVPTPLEDHFYDFDHVNLIGASNVSRKLDRILSTDAEDGSRCQ